MMGFVNRVVKEQEGIRKMFRGGISICDIALTYQVGPNLIKPVIEKDLTLKKLDGGECLGDIANSYELPLDVIELVIGHI